MGINRGKQFEEELKEQFEKVINTTVIRLYDITTGYKNQNNICDFIIFNRQTLNLFELKAIHGNTLNFKSHIRENQWDKLFIESFKPGVNAGIICWFIDLDKTYFIDIRYLTELKLANKKSFNALKDVKDELDYRVFELVGEKKRVFFNYYKLDEFLEDISYV